MKTSNKAIQRQEISIFTKFAKKKGNDPKLLNLAYFQSKYFLICYTDIFQILNRFKFSLTLKFL